MIVWLWFSVVAITISGFIGGYADTKWWKGEIKSKLNPKKNPVDNGRLYLAFVFFADAQSCYVNYNANGIDEVLFGFAASMIGFGPIAFGLGYLIRKANLPK